MQTSSSFESTSTPHTNFHSKRVDDAEVNQKFTKIDNAANGTRPYRCADDDIGEGDGHRIVFQSIVEHFIVSTRTVKFFR